MTEATSSALLPTTYSSVERPLLCWSGPSQGKHDLECGFGNMADVDWNLFTVLIWNLIWNDAEHMFIFLLPNSHLFFCEVSVNICHLFLCGNLSSYYWLVIMTYTHRSVFLSDICFQIFSSHLYFWFIFLMVSFDEQNFLTVVKSKLWLFSFTSIAFCVLRKPPWS